MKSFEGLFGDSSYCDELADLAGSTREAKIIETYSARLRSAGQFNYCANSVVANPQSDRTHFHLIYATRSLHGLVAFRDAEYRAHDAQIEGRAVAKQRIRTKRSPQIELFTAREIAGEDTYLNALRTASETIARSKVRARINEGGALYDDLVALALHQPLVRIKTLNDWLTEWARRGAVRMIGLERRETTARLGKNHRVERIGVLS